MHVQYSVDGQHDTDVWGCRNLRRALASLGLIYMTDVHKQVQI